MDKILIPAMLVGLVLLYPGWVMCQKAVLISRFRIVTLLLCLLFTVMIAAPFFYLPFWIAKDQERKSMEMMSDFVLWGICPIALIGLTAYVMDHLREHPLRSAIAGAACFAMALMPIAFYFFASPLEADMGITIKPQP